jgi:glucose-6-phosphate 1-dehydrogenase
MPEIKPSLTKQDILCAETPAPPAALVVFGASGDLTHRKILPSLFQLFRQNLLNEHFYLLGCGRKTLSDRQFRQTAHQSLATDTDADDFISRLYYISGDYDSPSLYQAVKNKLIELNKTYKVDDTVIFYLAVPPVLYTVIVDNLGSAKLSCGDWPDFKGRATLVVEKPFGKAERWEPC